jgi:hypothetical protein
MPNVILKKPEKYPKYARTIKLNKARGSDDEPEEDEQLSEEE